MIRIKINNQIYLIKQMNLKTINNKIIKKGLQDKNLIQTIIIKTILKKISKKTQITKNHHLSPKNFHTTIKINKTHLHTATATDIRGKDPAVVPLTPTTTRHPLATTVT